MTQPLRDIFLRPIGAFGWDAAHLAEAAAVLPGSLSDYSVFYEGYHGNRAEWSDQNAGVGATLAPVNTSGGVWEYHAQGGALSFIASFLANPSTFVGGAIQPNRPWYAAARWRMTVLPGDVQGFAFPLGFRDFTTGTSCAVGLAPSASPHYNIESFDGVTFQEFDTGIAPDTDWHNGSIYSLDGLTVVLRFDGHMVGSFAASLGSTAMTAFTLAETLAGGAAPVTMQMDEGLWIGEVAP